MGSKTGISWTGSTWNYLRGCSREMAEGATTSGCGDQTGGGCYAEETGGRFCGPGLAYDGLVRITAKGARWTGRVDVIGKHLLDPLRWQEPRKIFVASVSDPFHPKLSNEVIAGGYAVMALAKRHTFQNLTKRARRRRDWFKWAGTMTMEQLLWYGRELVKDVCPDGLRLFDRAVAKQGAYTWPLPNVWEMTSVEHQPAADERIPALLETPAAIRGLSIEPLIGPVSLGLPKTWLVGATARKILSDHGARGPVPEMLRPPPSLDWVIIGCENGRRARPCDVRWVRALVEQCETAGVAVFVKQLKKLRGQDAPELQLGDSHPVEAGKDSKRKRWNVIERPYLDGEQYLQFPEVRHG